MNKGDKNMYTLDELKEITHSCRKCRLCKGRTNVVFGQGNPDADIMFIGEGPGREDSYLTVGATFYNVINPLK